MTTFAIPPAPFISVENPLDHTIQMQVNPDYCKSAPAPREEDAIRKALEYGRELSELANGIHCDASEQFGIAIRQLAAEAARGEGLRGALESIRDMPEYDQDDAHRLRNIARAALEGSAKEE